MTEVYDRLCSGCGGEEQAGHLEVCSICHRWFCPDCAFKAAFGRKFCSPDCARAYYFSGDSDDDEDHDPE